MHLRRNAALFGALLLSACAPAVRNAPTAGSATPSGAADAAVITPDGVRAHVAFLASDQLRGRDTPSPGLEAAAEYLVGQLRSYGLQPAGEDNGFLQRYPFYSTTMSAGGMEFRVQGPQGAQSLAYRRDFVVMGSRVASAGGGAVFGGTFSQALDRPANSVAGRVLVAHIPGAPGVELMTAGRRAAATGATGLVLILDPQIPAQAMGSIAQALEGGAGAGQPIPVFIVHHAAGRELLRAGGLDLDRLRTASGPPELAPLTGATLTLNSSARSTESRPPNVVAVLPGSDPQLRGEYVVLSAHFDHVGVGRPDATGDSIYNGADDDASGTAVLLAVAQALSRLPRAPARSVMFLAVSGEEKGLLGSAYYVDHPTVPLDRIVANINMDMVGRNDADTVVAIGQEYSSLGPLTHRVSAAHRELGFTIAPDLDPKEQVFFRSDHFSFARKEIPAIFFTTWLHEDYHKPSDEVEKVDAQKLARVARLVFHVTRAVADDPARPQWTPEGLSAVRAATR